MRGRWQLIGTAPTDGRLLYLRVDMDGGDLVGVGMFENGLWVEENGEAWEPQPTHWNYIRDEPLPSPDGGKG